MKSATQLRCPASRFSGRKPYAAFFSSNPYLICGSCYAFFVAVSSFFPQIVYADIVDLKNGHQLEGRLEKLPGGSVRLMIDLDKTVTLRAEEIAKITAKIAPIDQLAQDLASLDAQDRDGLVQLAGWAELKGLSKSSLQVYRRILKIDPHHNGARARLGYVVHRNRWHSRKVLRKRGLIEYRGAWRTRSEIAKFKVEESGRTFRSLLADVHHKNKFIRENALLQLFELKDPELVPYLLQQLSIENALERMVVGRVLGNMPFDRAAKGLYQAYLVEQRDEVSTAFAAVLRAFGEGLLATWIAQDLTLYGKQVPRLAGDGKLRRLLELSELCPHRRVVPALIQVTFRGDGYGRYADRILGEQLERGSRSPEDWVRLWQQLGPTLYTSLSRDWLK